VFDRIMAGLAEAVGAFVHSGESGVDFVEQRREGTGGRRGGEGGLETGAAAFEFGAEVGLFGDG